MRNKGSSKITEDDVRAIRKADKSITNKQLAEIYGITHSSISLIRLRKTWTHVEDDFDNKVVIKRRDGNNHISSKLTEEEVVLIKQSSETMMSLSSKFNISISVIKAIKSGRSWKHVDVEIVKSDSGRKNTNCLDINRIKNNIKIDSNDCWIWQKSFSSSGYGQLTENGKYYNTHVYAYSCINGEVSKGKVIRHQCHNTKCCNPDHLLIGTQKDNWEDSREVNMAGITKNSSTVIVNDKEYYSYKEAHRKTGISEHTLSKYTNNGVFDVLGYREGCKRARVTPKV